MSLRAAFFPGQGLQRPKMLQKLWQGEVKRTLAPSVDLLKPQVREVLVGTSSLSQEDQMTLITQTENAQPSILISSFAYFVANQGAAKNYTHVMGHSLGEYSALVCGGYLSLEQGVQLVQKRGQFMQRANDECGKQTAMVALLLHRSVDINKLVEACQGWEGANVANINSTGQVVLSGEKAAIDELVAHLKASKLRVLKAIPLNVSAPFHSAIMAPVVSELDGFCQQHQIRPDFSTDKPKVISNASGKPFGSADEIYESMIGSPVHTVNWLGGVNYLKELGLTEADGYGPGCVEIGKMVLPGERFDS
ncbi:Malonyl CoA-acyl carrier protein transacylase [Yarrowia sp. C11]|nr:Malonyl CoA-acyl carrier protein transacylase [Yarrowia sp. C11]KAG5370752.1 Malonyl CoA-acyl carrier protein transacylase [Yarrowia sp. E02]